MATATNVTKETAGVPVSENPGAGRAIAVWKRWLPDDKPLGGEESVTARLCRIRPADPIRGCGNVGLGLVALPNVRIGELADVREDLLNGSERRKERSIFARTQVNSFGAHRIEYRLPIADQKQDY
jgi:hypothetical protein